MSHTKHVSWKRKDKHCSAQWNQKSFHQNHSTTQDTSLDITTLESCKEVQEQTVLDTDYSAVDKKLFHMSISTNIWVNCKPAPTYFGIFQCFNECICLFSCLLGVGHPPATKHRWNKMLIWSHVQKLKSVCFIVYVYFFKWYERSPILVQTVTSLDNG